MTPKYSIIIPTKNRGYSIWKAIRSVVDQKMDNWELLIVDGGSTDETEKVINEFDDQRIKFIINKNDNGVASARNEGIRNAMGNYIAYLDSDDYLYPNWLWEMDKVINNSEDKILFMPNKKFIIKIVDKNNKTLKILNKENLFSKHRFTCSNIINLKIQCDTNGMIHSRDIIKEVGYWNTNLKLYEDFEFLLRFVEKFPNGLVYVPKVLLTYTRAYGKNSLCSQATYKSLIENLEIVYQLHGHKNFLRKQTWYPSLKDKFILMSQKEIEEGKTIQNYLLEKYDKQI